MATSHNQHLDDTINALNDWDSLDGRDLRRIDGWVTSLNGLDGDAGKPLADMLTQLKTALSADEVDSAEIARLLTQLGSETTKAAKLADGELSDKIKSLGSVLSDAGKSMK